MSEREYHSRLQTLKPFLNFFTVVIGSALLASCGGGGSDPSATPSSADGPTVTAQAVSGSGMVPGTWKGRMPVVSILKSSFTDGSAPEFKFIGLGGNKLISREEYPSLMGLAYSRGKTKIVSVSAVINGVSKPGISLDTDGNFTFAAHLTPGSNNIIVNVVDAKGGSASRSINVIYDNGGNIKEDLSVSDDKIAVGEDKIFSASIKLGDGVALKSQLTLVNAAGEAISKFTKSTDGWYKTSFTIHGNGSPVCLRAIGNYSSGDGLVSGDACIRPFNRLTKAQITQSVEAEKILEAALRKSQARNLRDMAIEASNQIASDAVLSTKFRSITVDATGVIRYVTASGDSYEYKYVPEGFLGSSATVQYPGVTSIALVPSDPSYDTLESSISNIIFPLRARINRTYSLNDFASYGSGGIISIFTHGNVIDGVAYLDSMYLPPMVPCQASTGGGSTLASDCPDYTGYEDDIAIRDIKISSRGTLLVSAKYLKKLIGSVSLNDSVVLLTACRSATAPDFQVLFAELGASAVIGYDNIIWAPYGLNFGAKLLERFSGGMELGDAFNGMVSEYLGWYGSSPSIGRFYDIVHGVDGDASLVAHPVLYKRPGVSKIYPPSTQSCGSISSPSVGAQQGPIYTATAGSLMGFSANAAPKSGYPFSYYYWKTSDGGDGGGISPEFSHKFSSQGQFTVTVTPQLSNGTLCAQAAASSTVSVSLPRYSKISNAGALLPDSALAGYGANDWGCIRDNNNNYMYEAKMPSGNRAASMRFTNYTNTTSIQKCLPGEACTTASFADVGSINNAITYVGAARTANLCGRSNWQMTGVDWDFNFQQLNADAVSVWNGADYQLYCPYGGCFGDTNPPMSAQAGFSPVPYYPVWGFNNTLRSGQLGLILVSTPQ